MNVLQVHQSYADVQVTADECVTLARVCEVALEHFEEREQVVVRAFVETAGALFATLGLAGVARGFLRPGEEAELDAAWGEVGL